MNKLKSPDFIFGLVFGIAITFVFCLAFSIKYFHVDFDNEIGERKSYPIDQVLGSLFDGEVKIMEAIKSECN